MPGVHSAIPHGQERKVYEAIISGEDVQWQQGVRRRKKVLALEMDGEFLEPAKRRRPASSGRAALRDSRPEPVEELPALDSLEHDLEALIEEASGDEAADEGGDDVDENIDHGAGVGDWASSNSGGPNEEGHGELESNDEGEVAGQRPLDPGPEDEDGVPPAVGADLAPVRNMLASSTWGCFRITPKQPGSVGGGAFGGYEGACRFHKRNNVTGCKTFVSVKGPTEADRDLAFRQVLFWLSLARDYDRQRQHLAANINPPPSMEVILARRIDDAPDATMVKTDAELDKAAAAIVPVPAGKAKAKPRARGPKAKPKAASKAAARAKAAAARGDPGPDEAASDPISSASTSSEADSSSSSSS